MVLINIKKTTCSWIYGRPFCLRRLAFCFNSCRGGWRWGGINSHWCTYCT